MKSLFHSYAMDVDKAYIIRVKGNETSEKMAQRCAESCQTVDMPYEFWDAYDGVSNPLTPPAHHNDIMKTIKIIDHYLTRGEVACALSHISLWVKCLIDDKPLVILEHDAVMVNAYRHHSVFNSIAYLGCYEQAVKGEPVLATPPHGTEGPNYHFLCRAHAYAIDPAVARSMVAHVIKFGIHDPLDILLRADVFPMHQMGLYAYDVQEPSTRNKVTTILNRPKYGRSTVLNETLER